MSSRALVKWSSTRAARLDNLASAHHAVTGGTPGRKWLTTEVNHALIVRLASEFQGYCRDLHDESIDAFLRNGVARGQSVDSVVRAVLENGRKLDSGNAGWGNVCNDFAKLGMSVAAEMKLRYPARYSTWVKKVEALNDARNAIAHDDRVKLAACEAAQPLSLVTFRNWRSALTAVASGLDRVVGSYLKDLTGTPPW